MGLQNEIGKPWSQSVEGRRRQPISSSNNEKFNKLLVVVVVLHLLSQMEQGHWQEEIYLLVGSDPCVPYQATNERERGYPPQA